MGCRRRLVTKIKNEFYSYYPLNYSSTESKGAVNSEKRTMLKKFLSNYAINAPRRFAAEGTIKYAIKEPMKHFLNEKLPKLDLSLDGS